MRAEAEVGGDADSGAPEGARAGVLLSSAPAPVACHPLVSSSSSASGLTRGVGLSALLTRGECGFICFLSEAYEKRGLDEATAPMGMDG
jgi:hypothetical protein